MAFSTLLVLSLRSPLFRVPMANSRWGHGVERSGPGGAVRQQQPFLNLSLPCARVPETNGIRRRYCGKEIMTSQSFTFIDPAGNQAQYTVYDTDRHNKYHWSTDRGDRGFDGSYAQAQNRARTALKSSMAARRRSDQRHP